MPETPVTPEKAIEAIFRTDGSMRDITFTPVPPRNLASLIERFKAEFTLMHASDREGDDIREQILSDSLAFTNSPEQSLRSSWESVSHPLSAIQLFIYWPEPDGSAFVELSFHPEDLVRERFDLPGFIKLLDTWSDILGAANYFLREENMSWDLSQGITADVILTKQSYH